MVVCQTLCFCMMCLTLLFVTPATHLLGSLGEHAELVGLPMQVLLRKEREFTLYFESCIEKDNAMLYYMCREST